jgi:hypothetical protein
MCCATLNNLKQTGRRPDVLRRRQPNQAVIVVIAQSRVGSRPFQSACGWRFEFLG